MPISWKKRPTLKPEVLLTKAMSLRTIENGVARLNRFEIHDVVAALRSMLEFPEISNNCNINELIVSALVRNIAPLTKSSFKDDINKCLDEAIKIPTKEFYLVTSISAPIIYKRPLEFDKKSITFLNKFPKKFHSRNNAIIRQTLKSPPCLHKNYNAIVVKVIAKTSTHAFSMALDTIDLHRAIWNLFENPSWQIVSNNWQPINKIRLGEFHTIHESSGDVDLSFIGVEPNYRQQDSRIETNIVELRSFAKKILTQLELCHYKEILIESLLKYVRALDEVDPNTAFIKMWGALESLSIRENVADYSKLIARCAFLCKDIEYNSQILEHLREYRNKSIHSGEQNSEARSKCLKLQQYFRALLGFHLKFHSTFTYFNEVTSILDLPPDEKKLKQHSLLINKAILFRSKI